ncbi:hypothetical protein [Streptosporangium roseum]|uniref:Pyridoxamine 5'-phosphate oxidase putative domain-containing protein n=1 Tax=Streptosporangium roseum (strain ATCC 12428 / DSM 43021 / JCM 3005 / KCTC 9067 / NCIMB 10171 / NRRL 2505 / NI 9100) TaxID=479432 RepID=D2B0N9_STRRD|nr:hypothetical protein [Streptosporangium roseum]ACZ91051.1 hypothetical protein Sros_8406 [Streptosporangium roseum DSM 43021]
MGVIEEGAKKSGVLWLSLDRPRLAWHAWHDGAIYVVTGGGEQSLPGLAGSGEVQVTLRSKDNGGRLVVFDASVEVVDQAEAAEAVAALAKERLNAVDGAGLTARWAARSQVVRLTPREPAP